LAAPAVRAAVRRLRRRTEVSADDGARLRAAILGALRALRGPAHGDPHLPADGARRDLRPGRWRLRTLQRRCVLAGAALREDALRQRTPRPAGRGALAGAARRRGAPRDRGDARVARTRDDVA